MEEVLDLAKEAALLRLFPCRWQAVAQLFKDFALIAGELGRDVNFDMNEEVSTAGSFDSRNASVFKAKLGSGLGPFRDLDLFNPLESGNFHFGAKSCLYEVHWHSAMQVIVLTVENRVLFYAEHYVKISAWPAIGTGLTFLAKAELGASIDPCGYIDL